MKNLFNIKFLLFFIICVLSFNTYSQEKNQDNYNEEFNDILYLCKESWNYLEENGAYTIKIYSEDSVLKTHKFSSNKNATDVYMTKIMNSLYTLDDTITKISIDNKVFNIKNNNIKTDMNSSILDCINTHVVYCKSISNVSHNQNGKTYSERVDECEITGTGNIGENCSKTGQMGSTRMNIRRILRAYYLNRDVSAHWTQFMNKNYNYYTTAMVISNDSDHVYSVTIFTEYKSDSI